MGIVGNAFQPQEHHPGIPEVDGWHPPWDPSVFVYLSDIIVVSANPLEHTNHLSQLFQLLFTNRLIVNQAMIVIRASKLNYCGHCVDATGISPMPPRVDVERDFPAPKSKATLQQFQRMIKFCHHPQIQLVE